ncbi:MAG: O-antigen translocase [Myxococcales bacterium]|nr:O-antigen translocase [Myxococcales bacterium]
MSEKKSYRTILRTTSIMGAASVANIVISLVRTKIVAMLLGPSGIGLLGLFGNILQTSATMAGLGLTQAGTRQIAAAHINKEESGVAVVRRSLLIGTVILALIGGLGVFLFREQLAIAVFGDANRAGQVAWLSLGVAMLVATGSQSAMLTGLRRIGDLARLRISSAVLATVLGVGSLLIWGDEALLVIVLVPSIATFVMGHWFVSRLNHPGGQVSWSGITKQWRAMALLGVPLMFAGLIELVSPLLMRVSIQRGLGTDALGHFQASWTIGQTYLGFVLSAMSTDYFPRLSSCLADKETACRLVNEQSEVATLLAGPVVLGLMTLAPWLVPVLYSSEFTAAADMLRWQLLGDIFRVIGWPLSFVLLAAGMGTTHLIKIIASNVILVGSTYFLLTDFGIVGAGMGFCLMSAVHLPVIWWLAWLRIGFKWSPAAWRQAVVVMVAGAAVLTLGQWSELWAAALGIPLTGLLSLYALSRLATMAGLSGPVGRLAKLSQRWMPKPK